MALNADMIRLLQGSTVGEAISPIRVGTIKPAILQLTPGANVSAQVLGQLSNGLSIVRIAGDLLAMELPVTHKVGDTLPMTFMGSEPRPTFTLSRQTVSGAPVTLSQLGRLLGQISQEESQTPAQVNQLPRPNRLTEMPPLDTAALAERLREVVSKSGVFYESHVAQWAEGKRQLAELLKEPQGALSRPELLNRLTAPAPPQSQPEGAATESNPPDAPSTPTTNGTPRGPDLASTITEPDLPEVSPRQTAPAPQSPPTQDQVPKKTPSATAAAPTTAQQAASPGPLTPGQAAAFPESVPEETPVAAAGQGPQAAPLTFSQGPSDPTTLRLREVYQRLAPEPAPPPPSTAPPFHGTWPQPTDSAQEAQPPEQDRLSAQSPVPPHQTPAGPIRQPQIAPMQDTQLATELSRSTTTEEATPPSPPLPKHDLADPQTFPLIRQQLATLNTGTFIWQGEAWPGQQLKWEVEEREARENDREQDGTWQTALRLELPNLGEVRATLRISGSQMRLQLQAADQNTVTAMQAHVSRLADALSSAGLNLTNLVINHGQTKQN